MEEDLVISETTLLRDRKGHIHKYGRIDMGFDPVENECGLPPTSKILAFEWYESNHCCSIVIIRHFLPDFLRSMECSNRGEYACVKQTDKRTK